MKFLILIFCALPMLAGGEFFAAVDGCHDGDTCQVLVTFSKTNPEFVGQRLTVRLEGIDAPELAQAFGRESADALSFAIELGRVLVKWSSHDKYGRVLGRMSYGSRDVQEDLLRAGLAWAYRPSWVKRMVRRLPVWPRGYWATYIAAEKSARGRRVGLWQDANPVPPWQFRLKRP